ncbi:MAG: hypothetical protein RLZZ505_629 [Verrucomicrobiota bacterium]
MIVVATTLITKTKPMKIPSTPAFAALAAFTAMPAAFAQDTAEPVLPEVAICPEITLIEEPVIIVCPGLDGSEETVDLEVEITEPTGKEEEIANEEFTEEEFTGETEEEFVEDSTEEVTDGEVVDITEDGEGIVTIGGWPEGGVPIEWIKRGGGELDNPDVIFYSMAGGPVLQNVTGGASQEAGSSTGSAAARVLNQGETASDIENKVTNEAGVAKVAKKSTVAIVKEGRVFLR